MIKKLFKKFFSKNTIAYVLCSTLVLGSVSSLAISNKNTNDTKIVNAKTNSDPEFRSAWVSSIWNLDFKQTNGSASAFKTEYTRVLNSFDSMNMNAVTFQVRPASDAFYPSSLGNPWSKYLTGSQGKAPESGFDPLEYMVTETHKKGMEYHAWFNPYRVTESAASGKTKAQMLATLSADSFARKNPDLVMVYDNRLYLNPGEPKVQQHVVDTVMEVVKNYDVDGVNFDDYFYPYPSGFKTSGIDKATYEKYKGDFKSIDDWRRNNVDTLIETLHNEIKKVKPNVKLGMSPFGVWRSKSKDPLGSNTGATLMSYDDIFADTRKWVKEGWLDYITPQIYWSINHDKAPFKALVDWWADVVKDTNCQFYVGHAVYKHNPGEATGNEAADWKKTTEIPNQITYLRSKDNVHGSTFFSLRDLEKNTGNVKSSLLSTFYTQKVPIPNSTPVEPEPEVETETLNKYVSGLGNKITWIENDANVASYKIYRFTSIEKIDTNSQSHLITTVNKKNNEKYISYLDTKTVLVTKYNYVAVALDANGKVVKKYQNK